VSVSERRTRAMITNFLRTLHMAVARSFSGGVAICYCYVLPVLLMSSRFCLALQRHVIVPTREITTKIEKTFLIFSSVAVGLFLEWA